MTDAPADLTAFVRQVRTFCGFTDPNEVGMLPNAAHLKSGGYHVGVQNVRDIGKYPTGDYSTRQPRDRVGGNTSSAVDIGDNWPRGGRPAWLRFNNALVAAMKAADPDLAALRGVNFSPDGTARKRYDTNNRAQGVIDSKDTVTIHTHLEFWRNTAGTPGRVRACARILQLIGAAIAGHTESTPATTGDDMGTLEGAQAKQLADVAYTLTTGPLGAEHVRWAAAMPKLDQTLALLTAIAKAQGVAQADLDDIQARTGSITLTDTQVAALAAKLNLTPQALTAAARAAIDARLDDDATT